MKPSIQIGGEALVARTIGVGSIEKVLPRIVNTELAGGTGPDPSHIELEAQCLEGTKHFEVRSWRQTANDEAPGTLHHYSFGLELMRGTSSILLESYYLAGPEGKPHKLTRSEALFFLGLSYRALTAQRTANK